MCSYDGSPGRKSPKVVGLHQNNKSTTDSHPRRLVHGKPDGQARDLSGGLLAASKRTGLGKAEAPSVALGAVSLVGPSFIMATHPTSRPSRSEAGRGPKPASLLHYIWWRRADSNRRPPRCELDTASLIPCRRVPPRSPRVGRKDHPAWVLALLPSRRLTACFTPSRTVPRCARKQFGSRIHPPGQSVCGGTKGSLPLHIGFWSALSMDSRIREPIR